MSCPLFRLAKGMSPWLSKLSSGSSEISSVLVAYVHVFLSRTRTREAVAGSDERTLALISFGESRCPRYTASGFPAARNPLVSVNYIQQLWR